MYMEFEYTKEQKNAMKQFRKAWNKLNRCNLTFHNCYGNLYAYPSDLVERVSDTTSDRDRVSELECGEGETVVGSLEGEWSDDPHFIILTEKGKKELVEQQSEGR